MKDKTCKDAAALEKEWQESPRWKGISRKYQAIEVARLRPSVMVEHTLASRGARRFWDLVNQNNLTNAMGAVTGSQAVQMVKAGLKAIYVSGWQVAADANQSGHTYPDQSLYPSNSVPALVKRINNALTRADLIEASEAVKKSHDRDWYAPILADAEAGFGGPLHAFELMKGMIEAGAAAVHYEDQLASEKKCGHLGGKVLVPTSQFIRTLTGARLAADVAGVPTVIVARTDALGANLITSDIDDYDRPMLTGARTSEGYYRVKSGLEAAIARGLAYAPYADMLWFETSTPDVGEAREFAAAILAHYPNKLFAYNCSPSFNWEKKLGAKSIATFQQTLAEFGYRFQFITLAGWHSINYSMFDLASDYRDHHMAAYVKLQSAEFRRESAGYTATRHQREVGTAYFDQVLMAISGGEASTAAWSGSTEAEQFHG